MYNIFRILIEVPDYSSFFCFFSKNEEEAISPPLRPSSKLGSWGTNKIYGTVWLNNSSEGLDAFRFFFRHYLQLFKKNNLAVETKPLHGIQSQPITTI